MKILAFLGDTQTCQYYRITLPFDSLTRTLGWDCRQTTFYYPGLFNDMDFQPDIVVLQRICDHHVIDVAELFRKKHGCKIVYESDDDMWAVPRSNPFYKSVDPDAAARAVSIADACIASTDCLADIMSTWNGTVMVIENCIPDEYLQIADNVASKMVIGKEDTFTIGWFGGPSHLSELTILEPALKAARKLRPDCNIIIPGLVEATPPWLRRFEPWVLEKVDHKAWFPALSGLKIDIALAPIGDNHFNRCKSYLKFLEYGALSWPTIASSVREYDKFKGMALVVENNPGAWADAVRLYINDPGLRESHGKALRAWADGKVISKNIHLWESFFNSVAGGAR